MIIVASKQEQARRARQRRWQLRTAVAAGALLAGMPLENVLAADINGPDMFAGLERVSDNELDQNRGGFAVGNLVISFGISVHTQVSGPSMTPVTVTTNFTVSTAGQLQNLGTRISGAVTKNLQNAGLIDDGDPNTPTLGDKIASGLDHAGSGVGNTDPSAASTSSTPPVSTSATTGDTGPANTGSVQTPSVPSPDQVANIVTNLPGVPDTSNSSSNSSPSSQTDSSNADSTTPSVTPPTLPAMTPPAVTPPAVTPPTVVASNGPSGPATDSAQTSGGPADTGPASNPVINSVGGPGPSSSSSDSSGASNPVISSVGGPGPSSSSTDSSGASNSSPGASTPPPPPTVASTTGTSSGSPPAPSNSTPSQTGSTGSGQIADLVTNLPGTSHNKSPGNSPSTTSTQTTTPPTGTPPAQTQSPPPTTNVASNEPSGSSSAPTGQSPKPTDPANDPPTSDSILPTALPAGSRPAHPMVAQVSSNGSVSLSNGAGTDVLLSQIAGHVALIQNTGNDLTFQSQVAANYVIENYHDFASAAHLINQLSGVTDELLVMHGLQH